MAKNNKMRSQSTVWLVLAALLVVLVFVLIKPNSFSDNQSVVSSVPAKSTAKSTTASASIDQLTAQSVVADYLLKNKKLPDYYIRKGDAQRQGWDAKAGNLCDVLPGRAIGGDRFGNREKQLPEAAGRVWYEADINYRCGHRGADRLLYSNDGLIYVTNDHYRNFRQLGR